ncbi:hypothetical protein K9O30_14505 [Clostridium bowmanii]|uniref:hypothetical protein n=1 Tax=Clostridium bowmanii TaxID=132925 RepID=UPI001C0E0861|nr:hypothetical protein [Clostridium bowmanii]MBU3190400.1 hypothetical protein [Clostridium bowmanii]MCA1074912.1 hypothetical protein [Clostridium bowmanii]
MKKFINGVKSESSESSEVAATNNSGSIQQTFEMNIYHGKGSYATGVSNTFWSTLTIKAKIQQPQNGIWTIIIRDKANKNSVIYENHHMIHDKKISFNYKTGLKTNLLIEATWTHAKDTILSGEILINY